MARFFIVCLSFIVVFLLGIIIGGYKNGEILSLHQSQVFSNPMNDYKNEKTHDLSEEQAISYEEVSHKDIGLLEEEWFDDEQQHSMQKIAFFIEGGVKIFYEGIVDFLSHFASLFA